MTGRLSLLLVMPADTLWPLGLDLLIGHYVESNWVAERGKCRFRRSKKGGEARDVVTSR